MCHNTWLSGWLYAPFVSKNHRLYTPLIRLVSIIDLLLSMLHGWRQLRWLDQTKVVHRCLRCRSGRPWHQKADGIESGWLDGHVVKHFNSIHRVDVNMFKRYMTILSCDLLNQRAMFDTIAFSGIPMVPNDRCLCRSWSPWRAKRVELRELWTNENWKLLTVNIELVVNHM